MEGMRGGRVGRPWRGPEGGRVGRPVARGRGQSRAAHARPTDTVVPISGGRQV